MLTHAGKMSHEEALKKAHVEYEKYQIAIANESSPVEQHFVEAIEAVKKLETNEETSHKRKQARPRRK